MFLPQYNPYQRSDGEVAAAIAMGALLWGLLILLGVFLLCAWCTKMLLQHIVNPYLEGTLDREDGLIVVWSAIIWAVVGLVITAPVVTSEPDLALSVLGTALAWGTLWGAAIGAFLVVMLWLEVDEPWEPTHGFETITNLPGTHYLPAELDQPTEPEMTLSEIEAMLMDDTDIKIPMKPAIPAERISTPSKNGVQTDEIIGV